MASFYYISGVISAEAVDDDAKKTTIIIVEHTTYMGAVLKTPVALKFKSRMQYKAIKHTGAENIHCELWGTIFTVEGKVFVVPFNIIFTDLTKSTKELLKSVTPKTHYRKRKKQ